ncbi:MAG: hypothetical protein GXO78_04145 [Calditrichaeota bacterium]|nr:hypothetical protein [Calditrichota bacterium]
MKLSILIIHPEGETVKKLRRTLIQAGYRVHMAHDVEMAREMMEHNKVNLIMIPPHQGFPIISPEDSP